MAMIRVKNSVIITLSQHKFVLVELGHDVDWLFEIKPSIQNLLTSFNIHSKTYYHDDLAKRCHFGARKLKGWSLKVPALSFQL
jgi:hypothetical protein